MTLFSRFNQHKAQDSSCHPAHGTIQDAAVGPRDARGSKAAHADAHDCDCPRGRALRWLGPRHHCRSLRSGQCRPRPGDWLRTTMVRAPIDAGSYGVTASFAGNGQYCSATNTAMITIEQAIPTVDVTPASVTYNGNQQGTTAEVFGVGGVCLGPAQMFYNSGFTPADVGDYTATGYFAGDTDYKSAIGTATFSITPATPTVVVTPASVTYDGNQQGTTAEAFGVGGVDLGPAQMFYNSGFTPADVGDYTATGYFAGNNDYTSAMGTADFSITPATPTVVVTPASVTYNGNQQGTTAEAYGVGGVDLGPAQVFYNSGFTPADVGDYTATGYFAGNNDYTSATGMAAFSITPATPTVVVTPASVTYNGNQQGTTAEAFGVGGVDLGPAQVFYNSGFTPADVGDYTATGYFAGNNDYTSAMGTADFSITPATPTVVVTPASVAYNGNQQGTTAEAYGVGGVDLGPAQVFYNSGFTPVDAGSYIATGYYAGDNDYTSATGTAAFTITQATPTVVVVPLSVGYDGNQHGTAAEAFGVNGEDLGAAQVTYSGGSVPTHAGSFTATGSFAGNNDYVAATGMATLTITKATPVISWSNPSAITNPTPLSGTQLDATTNVVGTFVYSPVAGTVLPAGSQTLSTTFAPTDTTDYTTATASVTLQVNAASGPGISVSGTTLIIVGGSSSSDQILINPAGSSNNGSTGVQVIATLNGINASKTFSQNITTITITEGNGSENIQLSGSLSVTITAGNGNVNLSGGNDNVAVALGNGNDNISLGNGVVSVTAGNGNDSVNLGNGNDSVTLGNGNDNVSLGNGNDAVTVGNGNDNISLGNGIDAVMAGDGNENISLGNGNDAVTAGNGNDNISLGNGNDSVTVGNGNGNISLGNGNDAVTAGNGNNNISLGNGNDAVTAGNGKDNISLGNGSDAVTVGNGNDNCLGNGNDAVTAGNGNDNINLGNGNDAVTAGNGNDNINLGNGNAPSSLGNGNDNVNLGNGNDAVAAGNGNDNVNLGNGNDTVTVGNGNDNISLGNGNDNVTAGNGNDNVYLGNGNDAVSPATATTTLVLATAVTS